MKKEILASESFSRGRRHYFLDFKVAENSANYVQFTRSEQQADGSYKRWTFVIFQDHFEDFVSAFSSLFRAAAYQGKGYTTVKELHEELKNQRGIKAMPVDTRPREKMAASGRSEMENAELLTMLIGSGSPNQSALDLAGRILEGAGGSLKTLAGMSLADLCSFKGMGIAKSTAVMAAMELALRLSAASPIQYKTVYLCKKPGRPTGFFGMGS
jgi:DNA repair protein RadC